MLDQYYWIVAIENFNISHFDKGIHRSRHQEYKQVNVLYITIVSTHMNSVRNKTALIAISNVFVVVYMQRQFPSHFLIQDIPLFIYANNIPKGCLFLTSPTFIRLSNFRQRTPLTYQKYAQYNRKQIVIIIAHTQYRNSVVELKV